MVEEFIEINFNRDKSINDSGEKIDTLQAFNEAILFPEHCRVINVHIIPTKTGSLSKPNEFKVGQVLQALVGNTHTSTLGPRTLSSCAKSSLLTFIARLDR